jgi:hypothetical protein
MRQAGRVDLFWMLLAIAVCAGVWCLGYQIEPHRISKDGRRMLVTGQSISAVGDNEGRKREVWVSVLPDNTLQVDLKRRLHRDLSIWSIEGKAPSPPPRRQVYVLHTIGAAGTVKRMAIKLPAKSRGVTILDELLPRK